MNLTINQSSHNRDTHPDGINCRGPLTGEISRKWKSCSRQELSQRGTSILSDIYVAI